ncbi:hypothetical protein R1sor_019534 [Riccia sorocarpa]|uniref:Bifunctional inhibitor/plant lipid transfer protein/seed storage helical domain-containing protein n=1 Tax=Riccia sorocarpa TaxID=122646 RepID=A0ABD3IFH1_9MARC
MKSSTVKADVIVAAVVVGLLCSWGGVMGSAFTQGMKHHDMQEAAACPSNPGQLLPCLSAVTGSGNHPTSSCCSVLSGWGFDCLCDFLINNQAIIPSNVNLTNVLEIPKACGIPVPGDAKCGLPSSMGEKLHDMP